MEQQQVKSPLNVPVLRRGQRFAGRFDILDRAGTGAESAVYKVRDQETGGVLALKVFDDQYGVDPKRRQSFLREVELGGSIRHPNVVKLLGAGEFGGNAFILMEFLSGRTLAETLQISERLSVDEFLPVFRQMAGALQVLHEHSIVHRDIKPGNLMFGSDGTLKLMDFGIARYHDDDVTVGVARGTMDYTAPEQLLGNNPTPVSDLFSLGAVSYELLTGAKPFQGLSYVARTTKALPPIGSRVPRLPQALATAIDRCLLPKPGDRPASVQDLLRIANLTVPAPTWEANSPPANAPAQPAPQTLPPRPAPVAPVVPPAPPPRTLSLLISDEPRPPEEALPVMASLLVQIRRIIEAGDVPDPVTPATVRLRPNGEPEISHRPHPGDRDTWAISTPRYSAPELLSGNTQLSERGRVAAVLYSAGLVFYEILLGKKRFQRAFRDVLRKESDLAWMEWQVRPDAMPPAIQTLLPEISHEISSLFEKLLQKNPDLRMADFREAETAIRRCIQRSARTEEIPLELLIPPQPPAAEAAPEDGKKPVGASTAFLVGVALIVALLLAALAAIRILDLVDLG